jgi:hypothetical protein
VGSAKVRDFNIGIQSSTTPHSLEVALAAKTVAAIGRLGARIAVTVYAPVESRPMIKIQSDGSALTVR